MFDFSNKKTQKRIASVVAIILAVVMVLSCIVTSVGSF